MGAEVTRIEQPSEIAKADRAHNVQSVDSRVRRRIRAYDLFTRNKKSVLVDLKKEEAREIIDYWPFTFSGAHITSVRLRIQLGVSIYFVCFICRRAP